MAILVKCEQTDAQKIFLSKNGKFKFFNLRPNFHFSEIAIFYHLLTHLEDKI